MTDLATLTRARRFLEFVGYEDDQLLEQYPVWIPDPKSVELADLVAFSRTAPRDMTTALVVVSLDGLQKAHRVACALGAPFVVRPQSGGFDLRIAKPDRLQQWRVVDDDSIDQVKPFMQPEAATRIKVGLRQLPLFKTPVDFLEPARTGSAESLGRIVGEALQSTAAALAADYGKATTKPRRNHREAARLVVGALTALVTRDTNPTAPAADPRASQTANTVIERAVEQFPQTFEWWHNATPQERELLTQLTDQLGLGINYRSLDPAILCHVYEQALVDEHKRRALGIHYTPPGLAARLLASLPIEIIDPEDRHVLDPTCGSGSLLIAAHERLLRLQPLDRTLDARHRDLQKHLKGYDLDDFAAETARLALLLKSQPAGNGWAIEATDTLAIKQVQPRPRIIVMNPPWRLRRTDKRHQVADDFVRWAADMLAPGGLLGTIIPTSWLSADNSAHTRERISREFDVFEIWRLPQNTFATSRQSPAVVLARKQDRTHTTGRRLVRHVWRHERDTFLAGDAPLANFVVGSTSRALSRAMPRMRFSASTCLLEEIATVVSGQQTKPGVRDRGTGVPYLPRFQDIRPYAQVNVSDGLWHLRFPEDFQGGRGHSIIDKRKVLVPAAGDPGNPWRFKVALDLHGIACSNSMRAAAPRDQADDNLLYALLAILGSGFASAHVSCFGIDRNIPANVLKSLPVPTNRAAMQDLAALGRAATDSVHEPDRLSDVVIEIEDAVWSIYRVDHDFKKHATRLLAGHEAPDGSVRYETGDPDANRSKSRMRRLGVVHQVRGSRVDIWINGITASDGVTIEVPPRMPGWLLRPGATFDARSIESVDDITHAKFEFQPMSWQTFGFTDSPDSLSGS